MEFLDYTFVPLLLLSYTWFHVFPFLFLLCFAVFVYILYTLFYF